MQHFWVDFVVMMLLRVCCEFMVPLSMMLLIYNVLLDNIETHFEDIVLLIVIFETFFLVLCINVAQLLGSLRMFYTHLFLEVIKYYKSIVHIS